MAKRDIVLNNFWWKVTALLISIAVWVGFHTKDQLQLFPAGFHVGFSTREMVSHPITIAKPANDTREFRVNPTTTDITISGDLEKLKKLDSRNIKATVDLGDFKSTNTDLDINVTVPQGFSIESVSPDRVKVEVVKEQTGTGGS
jgi:hypothetical protein